MTQMPSLDVIVGGGSDDDEGDQSLLLDLVDFVQDLLTKQPCQ